MKLQIFARSIYYAITACAFISLIAICASDLGWFATAIAVLNCLSCLVQTGFFELFCRKHKELKAKNEALRAERLKDFL